MNIGTGILHPLISNQFSITFDQFPNSVLTSQIVKAKIDVLNKKCFIDFEIPLAFEQFDNELQKLLKLPLVNLVISSSQLSNPVIGLEACKLVSAWFDLDYSIATTVKLYTEFTFNHVVSASKLTVVEV